MESNTIDEKFVYKKSDIIALYAFHFVWWTMAIVIPSIMLGVLPKHYFIYALIQGYTYFKFHKQCQHYISNNIKVLTEYDPQEGHEAFRKRMNEDCGTTATNSWRTETNLYSGSSLTSSSNTYILNNIINKTP
jgi:hypothetical protein